MTHWTEHDLPDLSGTNAVVTGANSGLGFATATALARAGAHVVLACRDPLRGDEALGQVRVSVPGSSVELALLDLADLASVEAFASAVLRSTPRLHLLINNAGVMAIPRRTTADGFEMQFGVNHLGHFALTARLLPGLLSGVASGDQRPSRVVTVSSGAHRMVRGLNRDDLMGERSYKPWAAYGQSKLANLLFATELDRRARAAGVPLLSLAAHPGYADTNLQAVGPRMSGSRVSERLARLANRLFAQSAAAGALPILRAATDPSAESGQYYGPKGLMESRGAPGLVAMSAAATDEDNAAWLWQRSVQLTGVEPSFG